MASIEERLQKLEAAQKANPGAIILCLDADGSANYTTRKGERKTFETEAAALEYINGKFDDAAVVIIDL